MKRAFRVGILADPSSELHPPLPDVAAALRKAGAEVSVIDPRLGVRWLDADRLLTQCHIVIARANNWEVLCLLGLAEARGIATINRRAAVAGVHNKVEMANRLAAAGVWTPAAFARLQSLGREPSRRVKLLGIGGEVWSVGPSTSEPALAGRAHRLLAHRCREIFGLDMYSIDCVETADEMLVLDVDDLPDYAGIAGAAERLTELILWRSGRGNRAQRRSVRA